MLFQIELRLYNLYQTNLQHFKPLHWRDYPTECFYFLILLIVGWSYKRPFTHPSHCLLVIQASVFSSFSSFAGHTSVRFLVLIVCWSYKCPFSRPSHRLLVIQVSVFSSYCRLLVIQASVFSSLSWFAGHVSVRLLPEKGFYSERLLASLCTHSKRRLIPVPFLQTLPELVTQLKGLPYLRTSVHRFCQRPQLQKSWVLIRLCNQQSIEGHT